MCGINGFIAFERQLPAGVLRHMNDAIRHRGPDDEGYILADAHAISAYHGIDSIAQVKAQTRQLNESMLSRAGMGFRRLSVMDLSECGHQPMLSSDKRVAITFNGEIYNFHSLRKELAQQGYDFKSTGDTEVVLAAYLHWGIGFIHRLNGMFAIAVYDARNKDLLLIRDRIGIKPLFYHQGDRFLLWASEIKAMLATSLVQPKPDWQNIFANYELQAGPAPATAFKNISSLEPGCYLRITPEGNIEQHRYWDVPSGGENIRITAAEAATELEQRLKSILQLQLHADIPVTSLMSGGIDSTTITAMAAQQHPALHAYTLGIDGSGTGMDELPQALAMAKKLNIRHHVHMLSAEDITACLDATLRHYEAPYNILEPADEAAAFIAQSGHHVVLSGLGADEVFGGYNYYLNYPQWLQRRKLAALAACIPPLSLRIIKARNYLANDTSLKYYAYSRMSMKPYDFRLLGITLKKPASSLLEQSLPQKINTAQIPEAFFYYDLKHNVGNHHAFREDLSYMRHSVEARYPFLDHELIEWAATLPHEVHYSLAESKPLLRRVAEKYITAGNLNMAKKGFNLPFGQQLLQHKPFEAYCLQQLQALKKRGLFEKRTIDYWWQRRGQEYFFYRLWLLITTEVWLQEYIDLQTQR